MKRNKKTEQEKELRRLYEEYLHYANNRRGETIELEEPYQQGWKRYYVLREDVKNRRDAHVIARLLDKINRTIYSNRKDFQVYESKSGKWHPKEHPLKDLTPKEYENLNEQEKAFFGEGWTNGRYTVRLSGISYVGNDLRKVYFFRYPWMFVPKTVPHMITHRWIPDQEWDSRKQEIWNVIEKNNLWPKIYSKIYGERYRGYRDPKYVRYRLREDFEDNFEREEVQVEQT